MHSFKVNPEFSVDYSEDVVITAYVEGEEQLQVELGFSTESHSVVIKPINNCLTAMYQLELATEAVGWFYDEYFPQ
jgi:hypothetical protein